MSYVDLYQLRVGLKEVLPGQNVVTELLKSLSTSTDSPMRNIYIYKLNF